MATVAVMLMCAAGVGFLLYVLTNFARELRKDRAVRAAIAVIPVSSEAGEKTAQDREIRRVIEITDGSRVSAHGGVRRVAS